MANALYKKFNKKIIGIISPYIVPQILESYTGRRIKKKKNQ